MAKSIQTGILASSWPKQLFRIVMYAVFVFGSRALFVAVRTRLPDASFVTIVAWGTVVLHLLIFWGLNSVLMLVDLYQWPAWWFNHKIQDKTIVTKSEYLHCALVVLRNQVGHYYHCVCVCVCGDQGLNAQ